MTLSDYWPALLVGGAVFVTVVRTAIGMTEAIALNEIYLSRRRSTRKSRVTRSRWRTALRYCTVIVVAVLMIVLSLLAPRVTSTVASACVGLAIVGSVLAWLKWPTKVTKWISPVVLPAEDLGKDEPRASLDEQLVAEKAATDMITLLVALTVTCVLPVSAPNLSQSVVAAINLGLLLGACLGLFVAAHSTRDLKRLYRRKWESAGIGGQVTG